MSTDLVAERYARFAREEAPGRSELYRRWALLVARDARAQEILARIPERHRQPPLVFAVTRMLGAGEDVSWRDWLIAHADAVVAECTRRTLQTNEPLRCAALLPALSRIPGPIALVEVGASAGLCLYPDRYSYRYQGVTARCVLDPVDGPSPVVLECRVRGQRMPQVSMPEIVWRAGIDLAPLDPRDPATERWLTGLVWPGETGRAERIRDALRLVAADPPLLLAGDGADRLAEVAASAPAEATVVVQTPGVLAYLPRPARNALIAQARSVGRWITMDAPGLHDGWVARPEVPDGPAGFAVALDGEVLATADPLGSWWEWHPQETTVRS